MAKKAQSRQKKITIDPRKQTHYLGFEIVKSTDTNTKSAIKEIFIANYSLRKCPHCQSKLIEYKNIIPISDSEYAKIPGKNCVNNNCNSFFVNEYSKIQKLLSDNTFAYEYQLRLDYYCPGYEKFSRLFKSLQSSILMLVLKPKDASDFKYYIITSDKKEEAKSSNVLHYSRDLARELLTAYYIVDKHYETVIEGKPYQIIKVFPEYNDENCKRNSFIVDRVFLQKNGGYRTDLKIDEYEEPEQEIVDVLLYSPYTKRFEIARATFVIFEGFFMDASIYRNFIHKFGNPKIELDTNKQYAGSSDYFRNLRTESFLYEYGYNVNATNKLSAKERQYRLCEIVDLQHMSVGEIVTHIDWCIRQHIKKDKLACKKWQEDKEFIMNYKVNPNRFIIPAKVKDYSSPELNNK